MKKTRITLLACAVLAAGTLTACETLSELGLGRSQPEPVAQAPAKPEVPETPPTRADAVEVSSNSSAPAPENLTEAERKFAEGLSQYNDGNYAAAIRALRDPSLKRAWPELQTRSLKYLAFSYCVTKSVAQCRATFGEILKLDPEFELSDAEVGHPSWGPVFKKAQEDAALRPAKAQRQ